MRIEKDRLGLSLSLGSLDAACRRPIDLMPPTPSPIGSGLVALQETEQRRMMIGGIDVNRDPMDEWEGENDADGSSPNSTVSSACAFGKRGFGVAGVAGVEVLEAEQESSHGVSDEEDGEGPRKKLRLSKDQSVILEESFKDHNTLNPKQKLALAKQLNLRPRQVEVWFQNRRARTKQKQTEIENELLKRHCDNQTEEICRLRKEVEQLRTLKLSPQFYMQMAPPTTLTMCPACARVTPAMPRTLTAPSGENRLFPPSPCGAAGAGPPWAPLPVRPSFLDTPPQRQ